MSRRTDPWAARRWRIHFFRTTTGAVPAREFLGRLRPEVAARVGEVLNAVAAGPPPSFNGGGKWEALHDDLAGLYEVRVRGDGLNLRLFCVLDRPGHDLGGPSIVCVDGLAKPPRSPARAQDYRRVRRYAEEFRRTRRVARPPSP